MKELRADAAALDVHRLINCTTRPYPDQSTVKELFERCAAEFSDRIAVVCGTQSVTYRDLNNLANGLAARLLSMGADSGQCVGVCGERSVEMIVSLLAIIKSGTAYLPIDASWPRHLLEAIMSSFRCSLVVSSARMRSAPKWPAARRAVLVDLSA